MIDDQSMGSLEAQLRRLEVLLTELREEMRILRQTRLSGSSSRESRPWSPEKKPRKLSVDKERTPRS